MPYIISQILGGVVRAGILYVIATGNGSNIGSFATNGYGEHSSGGYGLTAALVCETVMTVMFVLVILGSTYEKAPAGLAGLDIGLMIRLIHLISIPVTNTSVNPARSISVAVFAGGDAITQLWVFLVFPILGAILAGVFYKALWKIGLRIISIKFCFLNI